MDVSSQKFYMGCRLSLVSWVVPLLLDGFQPYSANFYDIVVNDDKAMVQVLINFGVRKGWDYAVRVALSHRRLAIVKQLIQARVYRITSLMHTCIQEDDDTAFFYFHCIYTPSSQALLVSAVKWNRRSIVRFLVQRSVLVLNTAIVKAGQSNLVSILESFEELHVISPRAY
jgi:hypothetical protein